MKKRQIVLLIVASIFPQIAFAQIAGNRTYSMGIMEMGPSERESFNGKYEQQTQSQKTQGRGPFMEALWVANRSALVSKVVTTTEKVLDVGIDRLTEDLRSPRARWEEAVRKECLFSQRIWMQNEIRDFYSTISSKGPLDPENIVFNGFSCHEVFKAANGSEQEVFFISCKLDTSALKIKRMITHSKFEVYVDSVWFNTRICDIPNDSLQDVSKRIPFDFTNREDLHLKVHADITSSWINEGAMIFNDQKLGEFDIDIKIDPEIVKSHEDGVYVYKAGKNNDQINNITVKGESFIIPRSYSGNDEKGNSIWGTGQYKVDMLISEACQIRKGYYMEGNQQPGQSGEQSGKPAKVKWNDNWKPEWKLIQSRPAKSTFWGEAWTVIKTQWTGSEWLTEVTSPTTSYLLQQGSKALGVETTVGSSATSGATSGVIDAQQSGTFQPLTNQGTH